MSVNPRLGVLRDEFAANRSGLDYLDAVAANESRDLSADERSKYDVAINRMEVIEKEIGEVSARQARFDAVAAVTVDTMDRSKPVSAARTTDRSPVTYDPSRASVPMRSLERTQEVGEYVLNRARLSLGKITRDEADQELGRVLAHGTSADGTAPVTIEGDLIKFVDANRYAVNRARLLPMPNNNAPTFLRPRVTQRTTVGAQATQGDVLSSQRMTVTGDVITKATYGGVVAISEQEMDWTDPAMLGLTTQDLAESYAIATDTALTAAIETAFTASTQTVVSNTATAAVFTTAIATAAGVVYANSKRMADTLFVAIDRWVYLASLSDTTGRPLFPVVSSSANNVIGTNASGVATFTGFNILGLDVVVDPNFNVGKWGVAASQFVECYEQNKGLLSIAAPSTLETQIAYRGYFATNVYTLGVNALETS